VSPPLRGDRDKVGVTHPNPLDPVRSSDRRDPALQAALDEDNAERRYSDEALFAPTDADRKNPA
jgi:hypothetical protein